MKIKLVKKLLEIVVLGLLTCNISFADSLRVVDDSKNNNIS